MANLEAMRAQMAALQRQIEAAEAQGASDANDDAAVGTADTGPRRAPETEATAPAARATRKALPSHMQGPRLTKDQLKHIEEAQIDDLAKVLQEFGMNYEDELAFVEEWKQSCFRLDIELPEGVTPVSIFEDLFGTEEVSVQSMFDIYGKSPSEVMSDPNIEKDFINESFMQARQKILDNVDAEQLDLSEVGISQLPPEISNMRNLKKLNLSHNKFSCLPGKLYSWTRSPETGRFGSVAQNLEELDMSNNQLASVSIQFGGRPRNFFQMRTLKSLDFSNNQLMELPYVLRDFLTAGGKLEVKGNPKGHKDLIADSLQLSRHLISD